MFLQSQALETFMLYAFLQSQVYLYVIPSGVVFVISHDVNKVLYF